MPGSKKLTVVGRHDDTGESIISHLEIPDGGDVHFEILRHWADISERSPEYEIIAVFQGEMMPSVTASTLKMYLDQHFPREKTKSSPQQKTSN